MNGAPTIGSFRTRACVYNSINSPFYSAFTTAAVAAPRADKRRKNCLPIGLPASWFLKPSPKLRARDHIYIKGNILGRGLTARPNYGLAYDTKGVFSKGGPVLN